MSYIWLRQAVFGMNQRDDNYRKDTLTADKYAIYKTDTTDFFWFAGFYQIYDMSKLLFLIMLAVFSTALNCLHDIVVLCFCISKDQMSMHELFSLEIGGLDEDDDPY
jgi:hypothetical protein